MKTLNNIVQEAVTAALDVIDKNTDDVAKNSASCGDKLAEQLDKIIRTALTDLINSDEAPAFIRYE